MDIWLVEDARELRESLTGALTRLDGVRVTGCFASGREALAAAATTPNFDVALVDLGLPDLAGETLIAELVALKTDALLIALTVRCDDRALFGALRAGAVGYLTKDASIAELGAALEVALGGGSPFTAGIGRRVVEAFRPVPLGRRGLGLTAREIDVLESLCTGASYLEVANQLGIGHGTVQTHVKNIYEKLGASSKADAVRIALGTEGAPFVRS